MNILNKIRWIFKHWNNIEKWSIPYNQLTEFGKRNLYGTCSGCQCLKLVGHVSNINNKHFFEYFCAKYKTHVECKERLDICIENHGYEI